MKILAVSALSYIGFYSPIYTSIKLTTQHWMEDCRLVSPVTDSMVYIAIHPLSPFGLPCRSWLHFAIAFRHRIILRHAEIGGRHVLAVQQK
jgi:hypothetical protein